MSTTNDIIQSIVEGIGNLPSKSEIDTPTNDIDELATEEQDGLMSKEDKAKLNRIGVMENGITLPVAAYDSLGAVKSASTVNDTSGLNPCPIIDGVVYYNGNYNTDTLMDYIKSNYIMTDNISSLSLLPDDSAPVYIHKSTLKHRLINGNGKEFASFDTISSVSIGYNMASENNDGIMSSEDKVKLNGIEEGANNYKLPTASSSTLGGVTTTSDVTSTIGLAACPIIGGVPYYNPGTEIIVDSALDSESTNPLQNSAICEALDTKFNVSGGDITGATYIHNTKTGGLQVRHVDGDYTAYDGALYLNYVTKGSAIRAYGPIETDYTLTVKNKSSYGQIVIQNTSVSNGKDYILRSDANQFYILQSDTRGASWNDQRPLVISEDGICDINGNSSTVNGHTVNLDVPANAKFTDTTYSAGTGLSLSGTTINHSNSVTAGTAKGDNNKTLTFGGTFTIPTITYDAQGHITAKGTTTMTMPANPNSDTNLVKSIKIGSEVYQAVNNVATIKAVSTSANQSLTETEKANARGNIGVDGAIQLTYAEYQALSTAEKNNGTTYYITDANFTGDNVLVVSPPTSISSIMSAVVTNPASSNPIKIKLIGDSITHGFKGTGYNAGSTNPLIVTANITTNKVVVDDGEIGSSVSAWYQNVNGHCWANELKKYLEKKYNCQVTNYGCSGFSSYNVVNHITELIASDDDIIIINIGTNDRTSVDPIHGKATSIETYSANLQTIYNYCVKNNKKVIFVANIPAAVRNEGLTGAMPTSSDTVVSYANISSFPTATQAIYESGNVYYDKSTGIYYRCVPYNTTSGTSYQYGEIKHFHMEDVDAALMAFAHKNNIEYISLFKLFSNYCKVTNTEVSSLLADNLHPNDNGYDLMFYLITNALGISAQIPDANW